MDIRSYKPFDLNDCRALWVELVQRHRDIYDDQSIGGDNPGLEFDHHLAKIGAERIWLAVDDEKVIGLVSLIQNGQLAEIEPIVIAEHHRSKGIGRKLLNYVIEEAKKLDIHYLSIKPVARNLRAMSLFYHTGFKALGHIEMIMCLDKSSEIKWKKSLNLHGISFDY